MSESFNIDLIPGAVKAAMAGAKSSDLWKVPRDRIKAIPDFNVRVKNEEHQAQVRFIADSIKANGFFPDKPLAGFVAKEDGENVIYVIDGHTRLEAVDLANSEGAEITEIPVVTKPAGTSMEDLTVALVVSNEGRHLTPYEVALVCKRLIGFGMDEAEVARRIGKSKSHVDNLLLLVSAPRAITNMVQEGTVSASQAVETYKTHGKDATRVLQDGLKQAQAQGKSKVTGKHLKKPKNGELFKEEKAKNKSAAAAEKDSDTAVLATTSTAAPAATEHQDMSTGLLDRGIDWILENDIEGHESGCLLAHLSGVEEGVVFKLVAQKHFEQCLKVLDLSVDQLNAASVEQVLQLTPWRRLEDVAEHLDQVRPDLSEAIAQYVEDLKT